MITGTSRPVVPRIITRADVVHTLKHLHIGLWDDNHILGRFIPNFIRSRVPGLDYDAEKDTDVKYIRALEARRRERLIEESRDSPRMRNVTW